MSRNHELIKHMPEYVAARKVAFERDGHTCIVCGASEQLEADHITELQDLDLETPEGIALAVDPDNLQTLCKTCHGRKRKGLIRNTWISPRYPELATVF